MGEHIDPWEWQLKSGKIVEINPKLFSELNPLPEDLPGLIESLLEIRRCRGMLSGIDPSLSEREYDKKVRELKMWNESLTNSEAQRWKELESRSANASGKDRRVALQAIETANLGKEIDRQFLLNKLRAMFAVKKKRKPVVLDEEKVIREAIHDDLSGHPYVRYLDSQGLQTRQSWQKRGCHGSYVLAYKNPYWRDAIWRERSSVKARMQR